MFVPAEDLHIRVCILLIVYKQVYLRRFGHIDKGPFERVTDEDFERGLRSIQDFAGLPITGKYLQKALKEFKPQVVVNQARALKLLQRQNLGYTKSGNTFYRTVLF